ncbi:hypothetical protein CTAYLR_007830 [Chrysophaeum taylorii]|uniref:Uncharacterized protein n=1 Tax=Chrysophaeum taylorii TaxID=2483200 RepID=A0AAD7UAY5_9STRA|nr:hypothetical protein CTAYLR_007830 [Chrysophaeum taylorii]
MGRKRVGGGGSQGQKKKPRTAPRGSCTPLHAASREGDAARVRELLSEFPGAVDARDQHGRTALHLAAWAGQAGVVSVLLESADATLGAQDAMTPLHFAAQAGSAEVVEALLEKSDVGATLTTSLKTPLHLAAAKNHAPVVAALLAAGADAAAKTKQNETPRDLARSPEVRELLSTPPVEDEGPTVVESPPENDRPLNDDQQPPPPDEEDDDNVDPDDHDAFL